MYFKNISFISIFIIIFIKFLLNLKEILFHLRHYPSTQSFFPNIEYMIIICFYHIFLCIYYFLLHIYVLNDVFLLQFLFLKLITYLYQLINQFYFSLFLNKLGMPIQAQTKIEEVPVHISQ